MPNILFTTPESQNQKLPFMLQGLGINHNQEPIHRPQGMPLYQWIQCISGSGTVYIEGEKYPMKAGQGLFLFPNIGHRYQSDNPSVDWIVNFICFSGDAIPMLLEHSPLQHSGMYTLSEAELITQKLHDIYNAAPMPPTFAAASHSSALYDVLLHLVLHVSTNDSTSTSIQNQRIAPAIAYIEEHYPEAIFLDDLALQCNLSEEYLCSLFKKTTGMRIFEYIQQTRINHSKEFLIGMSDIPAHTIGKLCGFNSSSYFNKIFKKFEHISPGEFRAENGIGRR